MFQLTAFGSAMLNWTEVPEHFTEKLKQKQRTTTFLFLHSYVRSTDEFLYVKFRKKSGNVLKMLIEAR